MRSFVAPLAFLSLAGLASAAPFVERAEAAEAAHGGLTDPTILNFALALEHLEAAFYTQGLANYSAADFARAGLPKNYRTNIVKIAADEVAHVNFLTGALKAAGVKPAPACKYNFPSTTVQGFLGLAQVLEGVGVSAYLGAAPAITSDAYLSAAGAILTVEARHNAFIRFANKFSPFPAAFDTPQTPTDVITLAAPFFASCPKGGLPPITPHPFATVKTPSPRPGKTISIVPSDPKVSTKGKTLFCAFASGLTPSFTDYKNGRCKVPADITPGQIYVFITKSKALTDAAVVAGPAVIDIDEN